MATAASGTHEDGSERHSRVPKFDGDVSKLAFDEWKRKMKGVLYMSKCFLGLRDVFGEETRDAPIVKDEPEGQTNNRIYHLTVMHLAGEAFTISGEVAFGDGKALWVLLQSTYAGSSISRAFAVQSRLFNVAWEADDNVASFRGRVMSLFKEINAFGEKYAVTEMSIIGIIFDAIPDERFAPVRAAMFVRQSSLPHLGEVWEALSVFERQNPGSPAVVTLFSPRAASASASAPASPREKGSSGGSRRGRRSCVHCGDESHRSRDCVKRTPCTHCHKDDHLSARCWVKYPHLNPHNRGASKEQPAFMSLSLASQTGSTLSSPDGSSLASWWVLDDAATKHISSFECLFESTMTLHGAVIGTVGRATVPITKEGNVRVSMMGLKVNLTEVQLVPDARVNVLALERFLAVSGNKYHINDVRRTLEFGAHGIVVPVIKHGGLHWVHADSVRASTATTAAAMVSVPVKVSVATANVDATDLLDLHRRLGHANLIVVKEMAKRVGIVVTSAALKDIPCDDCVLGKSARVSVDRTKADPRSSAPGQYIHTDLNGPMEVKSIGGARYAMVFVDDFTRVTRVYPLRDKTETLSAIQRFTIDAASIGIVFGKGSTLHGDNGTEYRNAAVDRWCLTNGVMQTSCPPHTQALNGVAERYWRTVVDMARTMLIAAALPKSFWVAAMLHATAIRNLLPSQSLGGRAPLAVLTGSQPTFDHLHTFGAKAFVTTPKGMRKKWDPKAREGIYVGFSPVNKSHMVYIPTTGVVVESIHVRIGDLLASVKQASVPEEVLSVPLVPRVGLELVPGHEETVVPNVAAVPNAVADAASDAHDAPIDEAAYSLDGGSSEDEAVAPMAVLVAQQRPPKRRAAELGRAATRAATLPDRDTPPDAVLLSASMTSKRPDVVSLFTPSRAAAQLDPLTLDEALSGSDAAQWSAAYDAELAAMAANGTWDIVPRREMASGARALPVKVVFKTKLNLDGSIDKLKCRIVAKGFAQRSGVDYTDIYSPVVDRTTVRLLLALAAVRFGTQIHQMDVTTAFLNAPIRELVYLQPPPRISDTSDQGEAVVLRLNKAIYGLKQAPRYWHDLLDAFLVTDCNLVRCIVDPCLYIAPDLKDDKFLWVAVYVDDIFLVFNDDMSATALKSAIKGRFKVADLGEAHQWLGMEILATDQGGFSINQTAAIERLLRACPLEPLFLQKPADLRIFGK